MPTSINVTAGDLARFQCNHSTAYSIAWRVNDTSLSILALTTITSRSIRFPDGGFVYELTILALSDYNQTSVECMAFLNQSTAEYVHTPRAMLLIQGIPLVLLP